MQNKVLIKLIVPELEQSFDVFIPVNELIWKIKKLLLKAVSDLTNIPVNAKLDCVLMNQDNCTVYQNNQLVIQTDIRNGSEIILLTTTNR